jgi:hypothetical protein
MGLPDVYTWVAWTVGVLAFVLGAQAFGVVGAIALVVLAILGLTLASWFAGERVRRRLARRDPRFRPTDEVFADPRTGGITRVYVDPESGERRYWRD